MVSQIWQHYKLFISDSIMYTLKRNVECPLPTHSTIYGHWKSEIPKNQVISMFTSLGVKNYSLSFYDKEQNVTTNQVKLRGFNLTSIRAKEKISGDLMQDFLKALVNEDTSKQVEVEQFSIKIAKNHQLTNTELLKKYGNNTITKRILNPKINANKTYPFGFCTE